jgi:hypothetical protein
LFHYFRIAAQSDPPIIAPAVAIDRAALLEAGGFPIAYGERILVDYNVSEVRHEADPANTVGKELEKLFRDHKEVRGLKHYIGYWYCIVSGLPLPFWETGACCLPRNSSNCYQPLRLSVVRTFGTDGCVN